MNHRTTSTDRSNVGTGRPNHRAIDTPAGPGSPASAVVIPPPANPKPPEERAFGSDPAENMDGHTLVGRRPELGVEIPLGAWVSYAHGEGVAVAKSPDGQIVTIRHEDGSEDAERAGVVMVQAAYPQRTQLVHDAPKSTDVDNAEGGKREDRLALALRILAEIDRLESDLLGLETHPGELREALQMHADRLRDVAGEPTSRNAKGAE